MIFTRRAKSRTRDGDHLGLLKKAQGKGHGVNARRLVASHQVIGHLRCLFSCFAGQEAPRGLGAGNLSFHYGNVFMKKEEALSVCQRVVGVKHATL